MKTNALSHISIGPFFTRPLPRLLTFLAPLCLLCPVRNEDNQPSMCRHVSILNKLSSLLPPMTASKGAKAKRKTSQLTLRPHASPAEE